MTSAPELLYVNSKITEPTKLSKELFTEWYSEEHIPDIFKTSGIKNACRYYTAASDPDSVDRPYLALYPVKEEGYLQSAEFKAIPVHSEKLPGPSKAIFDYANFDTRYYKLLREEESVEASMKEAQNLITVQLEAPSNLQGSDDDKVASWYMDKYSSSSGRVRFLKRYSSRENRLSPEESALGAPETYLAIHEFENDGDVDSVMTKVSSLGRVAQFRLLRSFQA